MATKTFLLDLDNTLLGNDMATFLPPYFDALQRSLQALADGQDLKASMIASVRVMQANQDPNLTNYEAFMADFVRRIGQPRAMVEASVDSFYANDYPALQRYTQLRPEARQIILQLQQQGRTAVIATNPLFPATAIEQRLAWAGIDDLPVALVTHMQNCHFSKPNPGYYTEILAKIEAQAESTWMVGDDVVNDIEPARSLGLKTWWITDEPEHNRGGPSDRQGSLSDFLVWLKSQDG